MSGKVEDAWSRHRGATQACRRSGAGRGWHVTRQPWHHGPPRQYEDSSHGGQAYEDGSTVPGGPRAARTRLGCLRTRSRGLGWLVAENHLSNAWRRWKCPWIHSSVGPPGPPTMVLLKKLTPTTFSARMAGERERHEPR